MVDVTVWRARQDIVSLIIDGYLPHEEGDAFIASMDHLVLR